MRDRPREPAMPDPLAYFITWTTYGSWLPGDERGWCEYGSRFQGPDPVAKEDAALLMTESECALDEEQRKLVDETIRRHCEIRGWDLHALNCRTRHVHVVVAANCDPQTVMEQFKAWCSRRLKERARDLKSAGAVREK